MGAVLSRCTRRGRAWYWVGLAGLFTVLYILWTSLTPEGLPGQYAVTQVFYFPVGGIAVFLAFRLARQGLGARRYKAGWVLLGAALAAFWVADAVWVATEVVRGSAESPTWADVLYLAYYPLLLAALGLLSEPAGSWAERAKVWLDLLTVIAGGALLTWYAVLGPAVRDFGLALGDVVSLAYACGDLALLLGTGFLLVRRSRVRSLWTLGFLLAAVVVGFGADLGYGYLAALGEYASDGVTDVFYVLSYLLFGAAAVAEANAPSTAGVTGRRAGQGLPFVALGVAILMWAWALGQSLGTQIQRAVIAAAAVTVLAAARHYLAVRESLALRELQARKASEDRFKESLLRTQFLVDHAPDLILWLDEQGRITEANEAACGLLGYCKEELLALTVHQLDVALERDPAKWKSQWQTLVEQGARVFETAYRTKSGEVVPVEIKSAYMKYAGNTYCCAFVRDLTERKKAEAALHEAESQLRQAQKMEALGQLAGGIAHDFNNVLTAILGYSDLILASGDHLDPAVRQDVAEIKAAADRASALTRQILAFARRQPLEKKVVDVNDIVAGAIGILRRTLGEQVELVLSLEPAAGAVEVDETQLEQVIVNLALNARDAMPEGGTLTVETTRVELDETWCASHSVLTPGPYVMLAVSDTGIGMDGATRERAFEPFFTTKPLGQGTGLGLSSVYGTVAQNNGAVFLYSEPGRGTTVKIYLPRVADSEPAGPASRGDSREGPLQQGQGGPLPAMKEEREEESPAGATILVVEDEAWLRDLVVKVLQSQGHQVTAVATAEEALSVLKETGEAVDLLLTDLALPGALQGPSLAEQAHAHSRDLRVVYMSGYTRDAALAAGWSIGEAGYLEKPFTPAGLLREVEEALKARPRRYHQVRDARAAEAQRDPD